MMNMDLETFLRTDFSIVNNIEKKEEVVENVTNNIQNITNEKVVPPIPISQPKVPNDTCNPRNNTFGCSTTRYSTRSLRVDKRPETQRKAFDRFQMKQIVHAMKELNREFDEWERMRIFNFKNDLKKYAPRKPLKKPEDKHILEKVVSLRRFSLNAPLGDNDSCTSGMYPQFSQRPILPRERSACYIPKTSRVFYWGI